MSIDVEDYFHVSVFDGIVPRARVGPHGEPRRRQHRAAARHLRRVRACAARSSCSAGWPSGIPSWCGAIADARPRDGVARLRPPAGLRPDAGRRSATTCGGRRRCSRTLGGRQVRGYRAPSYSITPRSLWALDVLIEEGYRYDSSIFPIRHDRYGIPGAPRRPYAIDAAGGSLDRGAGIDGAARRHEPAGRRRRLLPHPARTAWTRWGIARRQPRGSSPAVFYLHPWEIDPDQPRLHAGVLEPLPALSQPGPHRSSGCASC